MGTWFRDVVTQAFNPPVEPGVDIGTPFHTPITALASGRVVSETSGGFGERIDIRMPNGETYYEQHLDQINPAVHVGSAVMPGEVLGLSGGQLSGGAHPNNPANSTGPHVELGLYGPGGPINPAAFLAAGEEVGSGSAFGAAVGGGNPTAAPQMQTVNQANNAGASGQGGGLVNVNFPNPFAGLADWISGTASGVAGALKDNIIPLVVAGLIILVVLGSGDKSQAAPAPQIVPIPV